MTTFINFCIIIIIIIIIIISHLIPSSTQFLCVRSGSGFFLFSFFSFYWARKDSRCKKNNILTGSRSYGSNAACVVANSQLLEKTKYRREQKVSKKHQQCESSLLLSLKNQQKHTYTHQIICTIYQLICKDHYTVLFCVCVCVYGTFYDY